MNHLKPSADYLMNKYILFTNIDVCVYVDLTIGYNFSALEGKVIYFNGGLSFYDRMMKSVVYIFYYCFLFKYNCFNYWTSGHLFIM